jgi:hypothetical protein
MQESYRLSGRPGKRCVNKIRLWNATSPQLEGKREQEEDCLNGRSSGCVLMRRRNADPDRILYITHICMSLMHTAGIQIGMIRSVQVDHTDFFKWLLKPIHSLRKMFTYGSRHVCYIHTCQNPVWHKLCLPESTCAMKGKDMETSAGKGMHEASEAYKSEASSLKFDCYLEHDHRCQV